MHASCARGVRGSCDIWHPVHTHCPTARTLENLRSKRDICFNASAVLDLMYAATYTLCPAGDAPDSPRVYSALSRGSIPLIDPATSLPPLAPWANFSVRIRFDESGKLVLPASPSEEARLRRAAWEHRDAFLCEAANFRFTAYVERSLAKIVQAAGAKQRGPRARRSRRRGASALREDDLLKAARARDADNKAPRNTLREHQQEQQDKVREAAQRGVYYNHHPQRRGALRHPG